MPLGAWRLITWLVLSAAKAVPPATRRAKVMASVWIVRIMELLDRAFHGKFLRRVSLPKAGSKAKRLMVLSCVFHEAIDFFRHCTWCGTYEASVRSEHHALRTKPPIHGHICPLPSRASFRQHGNLPCLPIPTPHLLVLTSAKAFTRPPFPKTACLPAT